MNPRPLSVPVEQVEVIAYLREHVELAAAAERLLWRTVAYNLRTGIAADLLADAAGVSRSTLYRRVKEHAADLLSE